MTDILDQIDHLIWTTPKLEAGMDVIERTFGIRPVYGGRHPDFGTHNALLSIGNDTYLEVMAPDPRSKLQAKNILFANHFQEGTSLSTWVMRTENIEELTDYARRHGVDLGDIQQGFRKRNDGSIVSWKATNPINFPLDGAIPFLISWGESRHPSKDLPPAGQLKKFNIFHPTPKKVEEQLKILGVSLDVFASQRSYFEAHIEIDRKVIQLS